MGGTVRRGLVVVAAVLAGLGTWLGSPLGQWGGFGSAAAEELNVENLPKDAKAYRAQVDQIIAKVDALIGKNKDNTKALAAVLDLMQTRDNVLREIYKIENQPEGSKWTAEQMRNSVDAMLKLLKNHYEKVAAQAG